MANLTNKNQRIFFDFLTQMPEFIFIQTSIMSLKKKLLYSASVDESKYVQKHIPNSITNINDITWCLQIASRKREKFEIRKEKLMKYIEENMFFTSYILSNLLCTHLSLHLHPSNANFCIFFYNISLYIMLEQFCRPPTHPSKHINLIIKPTPDTAGDSDQSFSLTRPKRNKNVQKKIRKTQTRTQRWSIQENKIYIRFLQEHAHLFRYISVRRIRQVFILLSEKMNGLRTPAQCKSHHQKMRKATEKGTIKEILSYMRQKYMQKERMRSLTGKIEQIHLIKDQYQIKTDQKGKQTIINVKIQVDCLEIW